MSTGSNLYTGCALGEMKRMISMQDREPFSLTWGCFDRNYWGWKFVDFPGARFQEGIYSLAWLFSRREAGKQFYCSDKVLGWAKAGMQYWRSIQYSDGSFDEAYPYEHSLAATAFTCFYVGEAYLLLEDCLSAKEKTEMREAFSKAGKWLCENDEHHGFLSNHLAVAAAALYLIQMITGDEACLKRCEYFVKKILSRQSSEGWYEEYGGADPGYQSHGMFYLARLWQLSRNQELLDSLSRATGFMKYCIHPDGTLGGEYGSRNTEFYFPAGFEILSGVIPAAADIARFMRTSVERQAAAGLAAMDSYNFFPQLNNYLFASDAWTDTEHRIEMPFMEKQEKYFPEAGLLFKSEETYYSVLGISKGGTLRVHEKRNGKLVLQESGYWARTDNGEIISSQNFDRSLQIEREGDGIICRTSFYKVGRRVQNPWLFIGFRLFSLTFGRVKEAAYWLKNILVSVLIRKKKKYPLSLYRTVSFDTDGVRVHDELIREGTLSLVRLCRAEKFATIHMGSSRYFQEQELSIPVGQENDLHQEVMQDGKAEAQRIWKPSANENQEKL